MRVQQRLREAEAREQAAQVCVCVCVCPCVYVHVCMCLWCVCACACACACPRVCVCVCVCVHVCVCVCVHVCVCVCVSSHQGLCHGEGACYPVKCGVFPYNLFESVHMYTCLVINLLLRKSSNCMPGCGLTTKLSGSATVIWL